LLETVHEKKLESRKYDLKVYFWKRRRRELAGYSSIGKPDGGAPFSPSCSF
jgi:hypothetical protein